MLGVYIRPIDRSKILFRSFIYLKSVNKIICTFIVSYKCVKYNFLYMF